MISSTFMCRAMNQVAGRQSKRRISTAHFAMNSKTDIKQIPTKTASKHRLAFSTDTMTDAQLDGFQKQRIDATYKWFDNVVIGQKLCPFAPSLQKDPKLMRVISSKESITRQQAIQLVEKEVDLLVGGVSGEDSHDKERTIPPHETTLVVLDHPQWSKDFREFVRLSWDLQEEVIAQNDLIGTLQLVLFHPLATHQTYGEHFGDDENAGDYTIRSPYPTVHLLREVDVLRAVDGTYPNLETLPARNQAKLIEQGAEVCRRRLDDCYTATG